VRLGFEHGTTSLHLGDCRVVVPKLGRVVAVVTDPPYGISHRTHARGTAAWRGGTIHGDADATLRDEVLARFVNAAVFGSWRARTLPGCRGVLVWDKGPNTGMGDLSFPWKQSWEVIYIRGRLWRGRRDEGVLRHVMPAQVFLGREHPNQKPVALMEAIIRKLPPRCTVFDPFMGSGSTGVAAVNLGRRFVGVEVDPAYFAVAQCRIAEAVLVRKHEG
jgi:tRNA G10  N-methylase Trm11